MKDFTFDFKDFYKARFDNDVLFITELDSDGDPLATIEITMTHLIELHIEAQRLKAHYHPSCNAVSGARARLEIARIATGEGKSFEEALKAYMDISAKHKAAFDCQVFH